MTGEREQNVVYGEIFRFLHFFDFSCLWAHQVTHCRKILTEIFKYFQQLIQTYVNAPTMIFQQPYFTLFKKPFMNSYRRRFSFLIPLKYGSEIGGKKMALSEPWIRLRSIVGQTIR